MPNGVHTLSAVAMDWEGNRRTVLDPRHCKQRADTTPPTIRILSPTEGAQVSGTVAVLVEARDNQRVARVEALCERSARYAHHDCTFHPLLEHARSGSGHLHAPVQSL